MGLLADRAENLIARSKLSPVEKKILIQTFLVCSYEPENAAREILRRAHRDSDEDKDDEDKDEDADEDIVPLQEALRGLKHDWYRVLELLSEPVAVDTHVHQALQRRDNGRCCLTGDNENGLTGRMADADAAQPFHILSPALLRLWADPDGNAPRIIACLEAFLMPHHARQLRWILSDPAAEMQLRNAMLLAPAVGRALCARDVWLVPAPAQGQKDAGILARDAMVEQKYDVFGFHPQESLLDHDENQQHCRFFECTLRTEDPNRLPLPSPFLLDLHSRLARATTPNDAEREIAKPWPPPESHLYWSRGWQVFFRHAWHMVPAIFRRWVYTQLICRGQQSTISEIVYSLPFGLYAKFCGDARGEPAALQLLERHAPSVPSPLFIDLLPLVDDGKPWLIMTSMPGRRLDEVIHRMSYPERHRLADDLAAALKQYRNVPNSSSLPFAIASASSGRIQDPRVSSRGCGPYRTEDEFNMQITRGCRKELLQAIPDAHAHKHEIVFTHADLHPSNILVDAGRLSGIVDWQFAGFYPAYWEYTKATRSVRLEEYYQAVFRRTFGKGFERELEVEEFLAQYFPIWGPAAPTDE